MEEKSNLLSEQVAKSANNLEGKSGVAKRTCSVIRQVRVVMVPVLTIILPETFFTVQKSNDNKSITVTKTPMKDPENIVPNRSHFLQPVRLVDFIFLPKCLFIAPLFT